ncbi:16124_t:CDS:2 [Rhizophagus irregularis]|nr:16124_t:CDS:2 [Rhizophagus irregularis]
MATNTTSHHLTQPPSTIGHMNTNDRVRDELTPPTNSRQRGPPSPRTQSKSILTIALQKAQTAVQFDAANNVVAALDAYKQTVELLTQVIDKAVNEADRRRLQLIHDTYADRIRLLSTIAPESDSSLDNSTSSEQNNGNNDDTLTQVSEDPNVKVDSLHRTDSIERKSIQKNDSQTEHSETSETSENENKSNKSVDKKIDNLSNDETSLTRETTLANDIDCSSDIKESIRNDTVDYMAPQPKRLSNLSQRSSSTSKSWISTKSYYSDKTAPVSVYEISVDVNTSQLTPSTRVNNSPSSNRVFVPPPPPKIAPPKTPPITSPTPNILTGRRSTSPTIVPPPSTVSTTKRNAPPISPNGSPSDEDDDKASVKSAPNVFTRPSSPPPQSPVEKLIGKALPHSRRPAPLPLAQQSYNSRAIPARSPSNPNIIITQNNNSTTSPRRTASNPGNHSKKTSSVRFFNTSQQNLSPQPSSPWMNSFSIISPPLGSPGLGPPTGSFRSEMSSISARSNDASYTSCLLNPFPNTSFYDEDIIGLPHISSNNGLPEPPPSDIRLKPFWLMRLLERTMTTGGYLTPKLFIPQYLWLQGHVKLTAIDTKMSSCEVVSNCLEKLEKISFSDLDKLSKALEGVDPILEGLQNSLARKLSYVESTNGKARQSASSLMSWGSKLSRGLDRMGMGNAMVRTEEANGYVDVLLKVFQHAKIVENYIKQYTSLKKAPHLHHHKQIIVRLYKFADFLGNVICRFVVRDLGILADKYLKKGSHWIVE